MKHRGFLTFYYIPWLAGHFDLRVVLLWHITLSPSEKRYISFLVKNPFWVFSAGSQRRCGPKASYLCRLHYNFLRLLLDLLQTMSEKSTRSWVQLEAIGLLQRSRVALRCRIVLPAHSIHRQQPTQRWVEISYERGRVWARTLQLIYNSLLTMDFSLWYVEECFGWNPYPSWLLDDLFTLCFYLCRNQAMFFIQNPCVRCTVDWYVEG